MNTFNFNRFSQALKCHFLVSRKEWIRLFGIFTLVLFMADLFFTRVQGISYSVMVTSFSMDDLVQTYDRYVGECVSFGIIFFAIAMLFGVSSMFSQMKDTRKRSAYLLWPVSNLEKYVISFIHAFFLTAIVIISAFVVADTLRVFVDWLTGRVIIWGIPKLFATLSSNAAFESWQSAWMLFAWIFYIHSLYVVGGTLFRRQQFLLTSTSIAVVAILLTIILNHIDWNGSHIEFISGYWDEKTESFVRIYHPAFYIFHTALSLLIAFHYWVSYKLFTRMQVINNKWLNV